MKKLILGIETSCDETGAAVYDPEQGIISNALYSQVALHEQFGGVIPEIASRTQLEKINTIRHDIKNSLFVIKSYAKEEDMISIINYVDSLDSSFEYNKAYSETGNIALDSIINYKLKDIDTQNIGLDVDISVPDAIGIDSIDIVTIVGNLLDNALCALEKIQQGKFKLSINFTEHGCLSIHAENSYCGNITYDNRGNIKSSKDNEFSGYGIKNIQLSVDKYNGYVDVKHDRYIFSVDILMYA